MTRSACLPRSELEEADSHVACWIGSESTSARCLRARRARRAGRGGRGACGRQRVARLGAALGGAPGAGGDRVDERRAVRARHAGGARLGGADRRGAEGQGGWRRWRARTDRIDARVLAELSWRDLVPAIWLPDASIRRARELARFRLHLVGHRATLKNRIHATLVAFGHPCPVSDLFGLAGRELLDRLEIADPWRRNVDVSLGLIDDLELQIARLTVELKRRGADHRYIPLLVTAPGFGWINALTVASEIGDIERFASPAKLCGYTRPVPQGHPVRRDRPPWPDLKARPALPALRPVRGGAERLQAPALQGALPTHQARVGPPTRTQGRPHRPLQKAHRSDLAHAHPQPALRSGRRPYSSSRPTALFGNASPERPPISPHRHTAGAIQT